ncbi:serine/threonine protein kinase [Tengunoibacter tsumagoiensis]|uniref:non-specific serine/threonine protein kinase n=1 Tax=Tengunoibacter tsumagoiensis TaxID=2014871 RepID=A0A402A0S0_9CHLR|nr:serine/threonine-protein kinase [Tengunoibacter tsumagoiensis]GCE12713.1 hypothetical protein KTT_25720 [Tengunoibacter tsumagoiensis]
MANHIGDLTGRVLGNCTLMRQLGQGGMGAVYLAQQIRPTRNVAVKVLLPDLAMNSQMYTEFLERFRREADVIARLEHVNIMPIYEYGEQENIPYLVMPFLSGGSLRDVLAQQGPLSLSTALSYIEQACSALDYAHAHGVIHRDLKPANFLLHADGRLILADFGIARMIANNTTDGATLTSAGTVLGTPEYMAPEMVSGDHVDYRADIYELGVVLFQMLTGYVPFTGSSAFAIAAMHLRDNLPLMQSVNPAIPSRVDMVVQKATAKRREDRFSSGKEMALAFRQACALPTSLLDSAEPAPVPPYSPAPLVLSTPEAAYLSQAHSTSTMQHAQIPPSHQPLPATALPRGTAYPTLPPPKKSTPWGLFIGLFISILIIGGGIIVGVVLTSPPKKDSTITQGQTVPSPTSTSPAAPNPAVALATGTPSYTINNPACEKKKTLWVPFKASFRCVEDTTIITNSGNLGQLGGLLISRNSDHGNLTDATISAQLKLDNRSTAEYGLAFRTIERGGYAFLLHPNGRWGVYVYETNGVLRSLATGQYQMDDPHQLVTLAVAMNGAQFSLYANNSFLGNASDSTYASGTSGILVAHTGIITASQFSLFTTGKAETPNN